MTGLIFSAMSSKKWRRPGRHASQQRLGRHASPVPRRGARALVINLDVMGVGCRDLLEWTRNSRSWNYCASWFTPIPTIRSCASAVPPWASAVFCQANRPEELRAQIRHIVKLCQEAGAPPTPEGGGLCLTPGRPGRAYLSS